MSVYSTSLYTVDTLTHDCVGRYITTPTTTTTTTTSSAGPSASPPSLHLASLLSHATYSAVWRTFILGLGSQYSLGHSMHLPPLGVLQPSKRVLLSAQPDRASSLLSTSTFLFHANFLRENGLALSPASVSSSVLPSTTAPSALHLNYATMARLAGVELSTFSLALSHLFRRLTAVLASRRAQLSIDFGVGLLIAMDGQVEFLFHDQREERGLLEESRRHSNPRLVHKGGSRAMTDLVRAEQHRRRLRTGEGTEADDGAASPGATDRGQEEKEAMARAPSTASYLSQNLQRLLNISQQQQLQALAAPFNSNDGVPLAVRNLRGQPPLQPLRDQLAGRKGSALDSDAHSSLFQAKMPLLLDAHSRTRAAPYSSCAASSYLSTSSKIACYYTPDSVLFQVDASTNKLVNTHQRLTDADAAMRLPNDDGPLTSRAVEKSHALYAWYLSHIDGGVIAPYKQRWVQGALALLSTDVSRLSTDALDGLMAQLLTEVQADYVHAVKRAILDYVLVSPAEQQRLSISHPPPPLQSAWSSLPPMPSPPSSWRPSIQRAFRQLSSSLYLNNPALLFLLSSFAQYASLSLFVAPAPSTCPLPLKQFESAQRAHIAEVCASLKGGYLADVEAALTAYAAEQKLTDENSSHFFDAVATVMGAQLRTVVQRGVDDLHAFVGQYGAAPPLTFASATPTLSSLTYPEPSAAAGPLFANRLVIHKSKDGSLRMEYDQPLSEVSAVFDRLVDAMLRSMDGIHRVETRIFNILNATRTLVIGVDGPAAASIEGMRRSVQGVVGQSVAQCELLLSLYADYAYLLQEDVQVQAFLSTPHALTEYRERMLSYRAVRDDLRAQVASALPVAVQLVSADCRHVNEMLIQRSDDCVEAIGADIAARNVARNQTMLASFKALSATLLQRPTTVQELVDLQSVSMQFKQVDKAVMRAECAALRSELLFLLDERCLLESAVLGHIGLTYDWLAKLDRLVVESEALMDSERGRMEHAVEEQMEAHHALCAHLQTAIRACEQMADKSRMAEYLSKLAGFQEQIATAERDVALLIEQERLLGMSPSEVTPLSSIKAYLAPFDALWTLASTWHRQHGLWMRGSVVKLVALEVRDDVQRMEELASSLQTQLDAAPEVRKVADFLHTELVHMASHMPLLQVLCNPGMRERHWEEVSTIVGFPFAPDASTTLARVLDLNLGAHLEAIQAASDVASKEWHVETSVAAMKAEWTDVTVAVRPQHGTTVFQPDSVDECLAMVDDHMVKVSTLKASPYAAPFIADIRELEAWLASTSAVLQLSSSIQAVWLYLAPLFSGADIAVQMPGEGALFHGVDSTWKSYQATVVIDNHLTAIAAIPHLHSLLSDALRQLESIQLGLQHYLESKRLYFPRFFFLSNDELLSILAETKQPRAVLPHMRKCFDGVSTLLFNDLDEITSMVSSQGETAHLTAVVRPSDAHGAVERWLKEFEGRMKDSVKDYARRALTAYTEEQRLEWMTSWPAQTAIVCSAIQWTANVTRAIQHGGKAALHGVLQKANTELLRLVERVRAPLRPLDRLTLSSLVVLDVHARDVVAGLIASGVSDVRHFSWQAQLRYYWNHLDDSIEVKSMSTTLPYQHEYLGNQQRLVVTALTDRCYRTLVSAIALHMGGATEGPAAVGKTETIKDLARAVGVQCLTFQCSEGLDVASMVKLFKGLCSTGSWSCFDEFNRIALPVLSVIAQQIGAIQQAKAANASSVMLDGQDVPLQASANLFITMNPAYSERVVLPDNLRKQFRCMAMSAPDMRAITQLLLYANGFVEAERLSDKVVSAMEMCAGLLSAQSHYDWGMRSVKAVVSTAVRVRQQQSGLAEMLVLHHAILSAQQPKLVSADVPVFDGLMRDLFGAVADAEVHSDVMRRLIIAETCRRGLQPTASSVSKVLQLYDTIRIRHAVMIVGAPYSAKTTAIRVLAAVLNGLAEDKYNLAGEHGVDTTTLNPKAVSTAALFGHYNEGKKDFVSGLLSDVFGAFAAADSSRRKWVVLDGPVDALWVESLNTALDDSRKLCLPDGHVVHLQPAMSVLFEVQDLSRASPATVSRCGMVHMDADGVGWRSLVLSQPVARECLEQFDAFVEPVWATVTACHRYSPCSLMKAVESCVRLLVALARSIADEQHRQLDLHAAFLFALTWSLGAVVDRDGRDRVNDRIRALCAERGVPCFPAEESAHSYCWSFTSHAFTTWTSMAPHHVIPRQTPFHSIVIPTATTTCYTSLLAHLTHGRHHALLVGLSGTGKSVIVSQSLASLPSYEQLTIHFSAQTSAQSTQATIDGRMERRRKGVYGASHQRRCVVVIEDLNLPALDAYGSQPVNELLRQHMDHGGWYGAKERAWREIEDLTFVAAMAPSGGGRQPVSERVLRHFHTLSVPPLSEAALGHVFTSILSWHFSTQQFVPSIAELTPAIVDATIALYSLVSTRLLPTPVKTHYTYNVRDLSRVFQGLLLSPAGHFPSPDPFIRLWIHEVHRVFCDRLVDDEDSQMFLDWVRELTVRHFHTNFPQLMAHLDQDHDGLFTAQEVRCLFFGDYMQRHRTPRQYVEIPDLKRLHTAWAVFLDDYNAASRKPMHLTLFRFAIEHVSRIARILREDRGHALLIGVGGSGKQSLTRLAASVMDYSVHSVELTREYGVEDWKRDLRQILRACVQSAQHSVLLLSDAQLPHPSFLEDVSGLLQDGSVPNLWPHEELAEVCELVREECKRGRTKYSSAEPSTHELFDFFTARVRHKLHVVLCMSPVGPAFADRLRMFPALVNCCHLDYYAGWPQDALFSVAKDFLTEMEMDDGLREACVELCITLHRDVESMATTFMAELQRPCYVTPTSYLELITTFKTLLAFKRKETTKRRQRYLTGLDKLNASEKEVLSMQRELEELQPVLEKTRAETNEMMALVQQETGDAELIRAGVAREEQIANAAAMTAKAIETECSAELALAMPMLEAANAALDTLSTGEISELKAMRSPPKGVKLVCEALCIMKKIPPARLPDPKNNGNFIVDYWEPSKRVILSDPRLLRSLVEYDKDDVAPAIVKKIRTYLAMPDFELGKLKAVSAACHSIAQWIYAVEAYDRVIKQIQPKREALARAQSECAAMEDSLRRKQDELKVVEDKMAGLNTTLTMMETARDDLEHRMHTCQVKIERANILISRLGGERERWLNEAQLLANRYDHLTGDMLLASGVIAYLGPFKASYRQAAIERWSAKCAELSIPLTPGFSLASVLGDAVQTRRWVIEGLPNDGFSIENALIISKSRRWPLMIDPQGQAASWIRNMERDNGLLVIKATDDYYAPLQQAITQGIPCLLQDVTEQLDPSLDSLLLKQVYKKASSTTKLIRFRGEEIPYSDSFRLFLTTKLKNPHYLPEVAVKVTLLNFMITAEGLRDQLLGAVVRRERSELEVERHRLVLSSASNAARLKELEEKILQVMSTSKSDILNDEHAIDVLSASKAIVNEIQDKQRVAGATEAQIERSRQCYRAVAEHSSVLFFAAMDLSPVETSYQFSLPWFMGVFQQSIDAADAHDDVNVRIATVNSTLTATVYKHVGRALFQKDRLLFALLVSVRLLQARGEATDAEWRFLQTPHADSGPTEEAAVWNCSRWMTQRNWDELVRLCRLSPRLQSLHVEWKAYEDTDDAAWKAVSLSADPYHAAFPREWDALSGFHRLCLVACLCPERLLSTVRAFVSEQLGSSYGEFSTVELEGVLADSDCHTPLLCLLQPGCDVESAITKMASDRAISDRLHRISLGSGDTTHAVALIERGQEEGLWVLIENIHLAPAFLPQLERLCDRQLDNKALNPSYRLFLTSSPAPTLPLSLLHNAHKVAVQPPHTVRGNLQSLYSRDPLRHSTFFLSSPHASMLHALTFALSFFHALLRERRRFLHLGFTVAYAFHDADFHLSLKQLASFVNEDSGRRSSTGVSSYAALRYCIGELNYGGAVTVEWDRRIVRTLLSGLVGEEVAEERVVLKRAEGFEYVVPSMQQGVLSYIDSMPQITPPEVLGLHPNAEIRQQRQRTAELLSALQLTSPEHEQLHTTKGLSKHSAVDAIAEHILGHLPALFDLAAVASSYPTSYERPLHAVLLAECTRYNQLLSLIAASLSTLRRALSGQQVVSPALETLSTALHRSQLPATWLASSYPSLRPLSAYVEDLRRRCDHLKQSVEGGGLAVNRAGEARQIWLGGLFAPQAFLSAILQEYARSHGVAVDSLSFHHHLLSDSDRDAFATESVGSGVLVTGLWLEGARWDSARCSLDEALPGALVSPAPWIHFRPAVKEATERRPMDDLLVPVLDKEDEGEAVYECPLYETSGRDRTVCSMRIPINRAEHNAAHWIQRGVALLMQLDD